MSETPIFWHLSTYPNRVAAETAKDPGATVMEALNQVWLFRIGAVGVWTLGGKHARYEGAHVVNGPQAVHVDCPLLLPSVPRGVRVCHLMSCCAGPQTGRPPSEGVGLRPGPEPAERLRARSAPDIRPRVISIKLGRVS
jgi:hypothetical protein